MKVDTGVISVILDAGVVPKSFKLDMVYSLLKKPQLDPTVMDNFHPVSNLLGKDAEKMIVQQIQRILNEMDYLKPFHF